MVALILFTILSYVTPALSSNSYVTKAILMLPAVTPASSLHFGRVAFKYRLPETRLLAPAAVPMVVQSVSQSLPISWYNLNILVGLRILDTLYEK